MAIIGITGIQRSGKTLLATFFSYLRNCEGQAILTNMRTLNRSLFHDVRTIEGKHFESEEAIKPLIEDANRFSILYDEAHLTLDSRTSKRNTAKTWLVSQAGKLMEEEGDFIWTSQFPDQVDIRLRRNTSIYLHVEKEEKDGVITKLKVTVLENRGDWAVEINSFEVDPQPLIHLQMYYRFEMVKIDR